MDLEEKDLRYLELLAKQYPSIQAASTEIINLSAILNLPKGTEHFLSDIHGEYEAFVHVLRNSSGSIKRKIEEIFADTLLAKEKRALATLIYYPERKLPLILQTLDNEEEWFRITLFRLIKLCRVGSSKYTRSKVRKALPKDFAYVIEELLHEQESMENKQEYYKSIIDTIIDIGRAKEFIIALSELIQRLAIDRLHIIGDVYDRGPGAHIIMDTLMKYHAVDFQWGNHDIVWMGAAAGSEACIANVIRMCLRYSNLETLENGYGISILPLVSFAVDVYGDDSCRQFMPKTATERVGSEDEQRLIAQMHKAITIIQLKLEGQVIKRRPHYLMDHRLLLDKIDYARGIISLDGQEYKLRDTNFPTIDPAAPYELTEREQNVVEKLKLSFVNSEKLQQHIRFLFSKGSMYLVYNGNLLYHGCISMHDDGTFKPFKVDGKEFGAKAFMDRVERLARQGYFSSDPEQKEYGMDSMWFLWSGPQSPLFGKDKMATFEQYFIEDKATHVEIMDPYYDFRDKEETACRILEEFGLDPTRGHIINGHVPVKVKRGENPVKGNGKLLVIDGGFSKAYQTKTGIAGYTLIFNSYGLLLTSHHPFESTQKAIEEELDIYSDTQVLETNYTRIRIKDTDVGREIQRQIDNLKQLVRAYRIGDIKER